MKTAIQQAIEYLRSLNLTTSATILEDRFLPIERQQITDAFRSGIHKTDLFVNYESYYDETYNSNTDAS